MKHTIIPYSPIIIPSQGGVPQKTIDVPILDTYLFYHNRQTNFSFRSVVDSGADFCVFPAKFGQLIGIDIKSGEEITTYGVGGKETLYFHSIKVGVVIRNQTWKFESRAGFSIKMNMKGIGLLGRQGFFDLFAEVCFNQKKKMLKLTGEGTRNLLGFDE